MSLDGALPPIRYPNILTELACRIPLHALTVISMTPRLAAGRRFNPEPIADFRDAAVLGTGANPLMISEYGNGGPKVGPAAATACCATGRWRRFSYRVTRRLPADAGYAGWHRTGRAYRSESPSTP